MPAASEPAGRSPAYPFASHAARGGLGKSKRQHRRGHPLGPLPLFDGVVSLRHNGSTFNSRRRADSQFTRGSPADSVRCIGRLCDAAGGRENLRRTRQRDRLIILVAEHSFAKRYVEVDRLLRSTLDEAANRIDLIIVAGQASADVDTDSRPLIRPCVPFLPRRAETRSRPSTWVAECQCPRRAFRPGRRCSQTLRTERTLRAVFHKRLGRLDQRSYQHRHVVIAFKVLSSASHNYCVT